MSRAKTVTGIFNQHYIRDDNHFYHHHKDWGYMTYNDLTRFRKDLINGKQTDFSREKKIFPAGALLTVFNTISKGTVLWQGTLDMEEGNFGRDNTLDLWAFKYDKNVPKKEWGAMFIAGMPATLERNGKTIHGALEAFYETGMAGVAWALSEYGADGYDGLYLMESGDKLTVYKTVTEGNIAWQGRMDFDDNGAPQKFKIFNGQLTDSALRMPRHMDVNQWQKMHFQNMPFKMER